MLASYQIDKIQRQTTKNTVRKHTITAEEQMEAYHQKYNKTEISSIHTIQYIKVIINESLSDIQRVIEQIQHIRANHHPLGPRCQKNSTL